jgi:hypothetical protein
MLAPSSRAWVVRQPQSTRVEGVNIVMKSCEVFQEDTRKGELHSGFATQIV